jgi:hypothetical protein
MILLERLSTEEYREFFESVLSWADLLADALSGQYYRRGERTDHEMAARALRAAFPIAQDLALGVERLRDLAAFFGPERDAAALESFLQTETSTETRR